MSEGFCDFSIEGGETEPAEFYHEQIVKARKSHRCEECGETISAGQSYQRISMKYDGDFSMTRYCLPCRETYDEFVVDGSAAGELWREMRSNWEDGAHLQPCLNRLSSAAAKEHMRRQWMKWKGLTGMIG